MITSWPALAAFTPPLMPCKEHRRLMHSHGHGTAEGEITSTGAESGHGQDELN